MNHDIIHVEIPAPDLAEAKRFYENVFCWNVEKLGEQPYMTFKTSDGSIGGGFAGGMPIQDGGVLLYITCEDIPEMLEKVTAHGGKKHTEKIAIGDGEMGYFAHFRDSLGNLMGLWSRK